ncbi:MAG: pilus assembly protein N-terminal domain-containing protein [Sinobacteraceae bacterium]|nr:pilus assembly protein N-terminal domain-containing protein [Nevskiaceae bacterium]
MSRINNRILLLGILQACTPMIHAAAPARPPVEVLPQRVDLFVGDSRVLAVRPAKIAVGNGKVLTVTPVDAGQLVLIGESPGSTVLQLWLRDGRQHRVLVTVVESDLEATLQAVRELLTGVEGVTARISGRRIVIEGDAAGARARERAVAVATLYPGLVLDFVGKIGWESMIHFDVRIVEFRRGRLRELGIRWRDDINGPNAGVIADFVRNERFRALPPESGLPDSTLQQLPPGLASAQRYFGIATTLDSRIRLLEQRGEATIVAEPTLSCRSGGTARFVAGGEIPFPVVSGVGATDVEYKEYGVILDVRPVADASGVVFARIETELSQVDNSQRVLGVPGLLKRRSATDVNLRDGETLVIAGLTSHQRSQDDAGVPGLSRLPAAGRLFGTRGRRHESSELVIFLTPRIVRASAAAEPLPPDPGEAALERARRHLDVAGSGS